jgi:hypothetical protein
MLHQNSLQGSTSLDSDLSCGNATINTNHTTSNKVVLEQEINSLCDIGTSTKPVQGVHGSSLLPGVCAAVVALLQHRHAGIDDTWCNGGDMNTFASILEGC